MIKEDIDYYRDLISSSKNDQIMMEENMIKMQKREEFCKVDCKGKIDAQVEIYEKYRLQINEQMSLKERSFIEEVTKLKE